jgi:pimeloyl-ACP methyl ester carboxylesterase
LPSRPGRLRGYIALGVEALSVYSLSTGTMMGLQYAEMFPKGLRALVLDSVVDHSVDVAGLFDASATSLQGVFDRFVDWNRRTASSALYDRDPRAVLAGLHTRVAGGELFHADGVTPIWPEDLIGIVGRLLATPDGPELAGTLAALADDKVLGLR